MTAPGYFLSNSREGFQWVGEVGSPLVKFQYDLYHMQLMEGNLLNTIRANIRADRPYSDCGCCSRIMNPGPERSTPLYSKALEDMGYAGYVNLDTSLGEVGRFVCLVAPLREEEMNSEKRNQSTLRGERDGFPSCATWDWSCWTIGRSARMQLATQCVSSNLSIRCTGEPSALSLIQWPTSALACRSGYPSSSCSEGHEGQFLTALEGGADCRGGGPPCRQKVVVAQGYG